MQSNSSVLIPRPEHPVPQFMRAQWLNLNGTWEFAESNQSEDIRFLSSMPYPDQIQVPFCRESKLSGITRRGFIKHVWYRRSFTLPQSWNAPRTLLHIGAADWRSRIWLNGTLVGEHEGGNTPITLELTQYLCKGENVLTIHVFDDVRSGLQPLGKQSDHEESWAIFYTRTTGIWQTVWLEGVGKSYFRDLHFQSNPERSCVRMTPEIDGYWNGLKVDVEVLAEGLLLGRASVPTTWRGEAIEIDLSEKRLWSIKDPFLYEVKIRLISPCGSLEDMVESYFGLRSVRISGAAILINDEAVFQRLVLDQGFYPDGVWTAPTDEALRGDIEMSMAAGFNGARLHQKVFEPRFLYWADRLGYLVWGEYPSYGANYGRSEVQRPIIDEWAQLLIRDRNHPSIIGWCPFNETPHEAGNLQRTILRLTRAIDPERPVIESSGWVHTAPDPEIIDAHDYNQDPAGFRTRWIDEYAFSASMPRQYSIFSPAAINGVPLMISEYGGIGYNTDTQQGSWAYGTPETMEGFYERLQGLTSVLLDNRWMFGFCYTQLTDVEQETNGIYTFNRKPKFDIVRICSIFGAASAYEKLPPIQESPKFPTWRVIIGAQPDGLLAKPWRCTFTSPGDGWMRPETSDTEWLESYGGFGSRSDDFRIRTAWNTSEIWLRQTFEYDGRSFDTAAIVALWDGDVEIWLNGVHILGKKDWVDQYTPTNAYNAAKDILVSGKNTFAVYAKRTRQDQYVDIAFLLGE